MKRVLSTSVLALFLTGCASSSTDSATANQAQIDNQVQTQLEQAATSVQSSLQQLAAIEKLEAQNNVTIPLTDVTDPALNQLISIKWYGPIEPLLAEVAQSTGYQFQVFGKPPSLPILVNIDTTTTPASAINIIRNVDLQAGLKCAIIIFPNDKVISLRYTES